MKTEYRVIWKREGLRRKTAIYAKESTAIRRVKLLKGELPPNFFNLNPDDEFCCSGWNCGCEGITVKEHYERELKGLPKLEYALIEQREVKPWEEWHSPRQLTQHK